LNPIGGDFTPKGPGYCTPLARLMLGFDSPVALGKGGIQWGVRTSLGLWGYGTSGNISTGYPGTTLNEHPKIAWKMGPYHK